MTVSASKTLHDHDVNSYRHAHDFAGRDSDLVKRRSRALGAVVLVTLITMVLEIAAGTWSGSLALTADGWHMGTHAAALGGAWFALRWSARAQSHTAYPFGGWKIEMLAAYSSALLLALVALGLAVDAIKTLIRPEPIAYGEALAVAALGLVVNLVSALLLARAGGHDHGHGHGHGHDHGHGHAHGAHRPAHKSHAKGHADATSSNAHADDVNYRAAYVHVLADAFTSVLAMAALAGGLWWGWAWLDPVVALIGAAVIAQWAWGLLTQSARALVDATADADLREAVPALIEADGDAKVADLHIWQVGPDAFAGVVSLVADHPHAPAHYRAQLAKLTRLQHVTVEVHQCTAGRPSAEEKAAE